MMRPAGNARDNRSEKISQAHSARSRKRRRPVNSVNFATAPGTGAASILAFCVLPNSGNCLSDVVGNDRLMFFWSAFCLTAVFLFIFRSGEFMADDASQSGSQGKSKKRVTQIGDFKLKSKLGQGGMGTVYLATQISLDRKVAIKTLSAELGKKENLVKRFIRECRSMAKLMHPNVVQVYSADSFKGIHYVAIEYINGKSLQDWYKQLGKMSIGDALHVVLVCADALKHAFEQNIIHRDIKPDNILVTRKGVVKLADFGLAKVVDEAEMDVTQTGHGLGTPMYMAPEQASNAKTVDFRSDIYALGITLYQLITGQVPFPGDDTLGIIMLKAKGQFASARKHNREIPETLDLIIDKMIARNPQQRFGSYDELIKSLSDLNLAHESLSFIDAEGRASMRMSGVGTTTAMNTAAATRGSGASSGRIVDPKTGATGERDVWEVRLPDASGRLTTRKMTTDQVRRGFKSGGIDLKAIGRRGSEGAHLPLAQFPEFSQDAHAAASRDKAAARGRNLKDDFADLGRQYDRRNRWKWLKNLFSSAKGLVSLLIYLALLAGVVVGCYYAWQHFAGGSPTP